MWPDEVEGGCHPSLNLRMTFLLMPYRRLFVSFHSFSIQVILLAYPELTVDKILKSFSHELLAQLGLPHGYLPG